jgi:fumarate hydratase class II
MNANEVIAALAGDDVHANDDVNMGQSSNDVFPSAVHLAALEELVRDLLAALDLLAGRSSARRTSSTTSSSRAGRTGWTLFP